VIDDQIVGAAEITRDITEQKAAQQQLREAEQRYRTVADFTYDWEYWEDPEGKMIYVSPSCERVSGYPTEAFLENPDLLTEIICDEDREIWDDHRHKAGSKNGSTEIQLRINTRGGDVCWIEHACLPVYNDDGGFEGIRASNRDITERKLAEEDLKKKDKMLEEAQSIARLGSWDWKIITNELVWSDEIFRIFGIFPQDFGATYEAFIQSVHPDDRESVKEAVDQALSDPSFDYNIAHRIKRPDGSERIVRERGKVTFDEKGKATRMVGTVQDITDIRTMESETEKLRAELSHMDRTSMMGVLTAGIAHEINQPLAGILTNAQAALRFLTSDRPDLDEVKDALHDIISDDKRAGEMVHSIRNIMGKSEPKRENIDFNKTVREVLNLTKSEIQNRKISIKENLQPHIPPVYGDRIQIQQVILNLLMNAMEALKGADISKPEVLVSTQFKEKDGVILSVSDSGPGIKPDQLSSVFESFQTSKKGGLGIGLPICRSIAERHGGNIWAENRPEGGATFFFKLPCEGS
jgi:PAS domain S-box-containing protein